MKSVEESKKKYKEEIKALKATINRLTVNKNEIVDALLLRDNEIKELTDPKGIRELHALVKDLNSEIDQIIVEQDKKDQ